MDLRALRSVVKSIGSAPRHPSSRGPSSLRLTLQFMLFGFHSLSVHNTCPGPFPRTHRSFHFHLQSLPSPHLSFLFSPPPAPHSPISLSLYDQFTSFVPLL
ncbi:unnamed protein product [Arctogadus glacialis]